MARLLGREPIVLRRLEGSKRLLARSLLLPTHKGGHQNDAMLTNPTLAATDTLPVGDGFFPLPLDSDPLTLPSMTICVGALCEGGKAAVIAADRKFIAPNGLYAEGPDSKIAELASSAVVASAGEPPGSSLLNEFKTGGSGRLDMARLKNVVNTACLKAFGEKVSEEVTQKLVQMDYEDFLSAQPPLAEAIYQSVMEEVKKRALGMSFLLAGAEETESHLYASRRGDDGTLTVQRYVVLTKDS